MTRHAPTLEASAPHPGPAPTRPARLLPRLVCTALAAAIAAAWLLGLRWSPLPGGHPGYALGVHRGVVFFSRWTPPTYDEMIRSLSTTAPFPRPPPRRWSGLGLAFVRDNTTRYWALEASLLWPLAVAVAMTGMAWRTHLLARHRRARTRCPACNYDLSGLATPTCPECGTTTTPPRGNTHAPPAPQG
jgi:hypothetical protein